MGNYRSRQNINRLPSPGTYSNPRTMTGGDRLTPSPTVTVTRGDGVVLSPLEAEDLGAGVARGGARVVAGPGAACEQDAHEGAEAAA